jgi:hypothetical protein
MGRLVIGALVVVLMAIPSTARADAIVNGGFETGSFAGWTVDPAAAGSLIFVGGHGQGGTDAAWFGAIGAGDDSLSQTFATLPDESYVVTFWLSHIVTDRANDFQVWWDSTSLLALTNASNIGERQYSFIVTADDDQSTLRFAGHELRDYYYLDNVSVAPVPTPEPASLMLLLGGAAAMIGRARLSRRKNKSLRAA